MTNTNNASQPEGATGTTGAPDDLDYLLNYIPSAAARAEAKAKVADLRAQLAQVQANSDDISAHLGAMVKKATELRAQLAAKAQDEPTAYAYHYEWAGCITTSGPQNFKWEFDREPPPEWAIESGQARNVKPLYLAAPASAQPDRGAAQFCQHCGYDHSAGPLCKTAASLSPASQPVAPEAAQADALSILANALKHAREALTFYANQGHFHMHQPDEWDTVSGEPQNFYEDSNNTATVEDGWVARQALEEIAHVDCCISAASAHAQQETAQPVATVVSRVGDDLRVGWLRPERCSVGMLLYCASEPAAVAPSDAKDAAPTTVPDHSERGAANAGELPSCQFCGGTKGHWKGCRAPEDANVGNLAIELQGVREEMTAGSGFWSSCSGCYDTEDGHPTGNYSYSAVFGCALGGGCSECGGIGAVWDNTDYEAMAKDWDKAEQSPATSAAGKEGGNRG